MIVFVLDMSISISERVYGTDSSCMNFEISYCDKEISDEGRCLQK